MDKVGKVGQRMVLTMKLATIIHCLPCESQNGASQHITLKSKQKNKSEGYILVIPSTAGMNLLQESTFFFSFLFKSDQFG